LLVNQGEKRSDALSVEIPGPTEAWGEAGEVETAETVERATVVTAAIGEGEAAGVSVASEGDITAPQLEQEDSLEGILEASPNSMESALGLGGALGEEGLASERAPQAGERGERASAEANRLIEEFSGETEKTGETPGQVSPGGSGGGAE
jgi:hypothetical protein